MSGSSRRSKTAPYLGALASLLGLVGCSDELDTRNDVELADTDTMRLGRIHITLQPDAPDASVVDDELEVTARFAFVRGLEEDFVRARVDMPVLAHEALLPGQCTADEPGLDNADSETDLDEPRELMLVDAGDMRLSIGDSQVQVPLSLVPDLLPYMSGVEYLYYGDRVGVADTEGDPTVMVEANGSQSELPPFFVEGQVPPDVGLSFNHPEELDRGYLVLHWTPSSEGTLTVRFTPLLSNEAATDKAITCVFADRGRARVDLPMLRFLGFSAAADGLKIEASRFSTTTFDAGDFAGSELVVERVDNLRIQLR